MKKLLKILRIILGVEIARVLIGMLSWGICFGEKRRFYLKCTYSLEEDNSEVERLKAIPNIRFDKNY